MFPSHSNLLAWPLADFASLIVISFMKSIKIPAFLLKRKKPIAWKEAVGYRDLCSMLLPSPLSCWAVGAELAL